MSLPSCKQAAADSIFKLAEALRDGGLAAAEERAGRDETSLVGNCDEKTQLLQGDTPMVE